MNQDQNSTEAVETQTTNVFKNVKGQMKGQLMCECGNLDIYVHRLKQEKREWKKMISSGMDTGRGGWGYEWGRTEGDREKGLQ